ncbi:MAG: winged helix-turn-helix domain-containing protein [archaeon]
MNWKDYGYVVGSKHRRKVMLSLDLVRTPTQIARKTYINTSHISKVLKDLEKRDLVKCLTPKQRVGKIYSLTQEGREIVSYLKKTEDFKEEISQEE